MPRYSAAAEAILKWGARRGRGNGMRGGGVSLPAGGGLWGGGSAPPQKILNFSISKLCVLVYSVALNLTFWLQQTAVKITH